jgi:hypothetical protein
MGYGASREVSLPEDREPWPVPSHCKRVALLTRCAVAVVVCCLSPKTRDHLVKYDTIYTACIELRHVF